MMAGYDVIAKAPTGTGKTCAFGIPVLKWLLRWKKEKKLREEAQKAENPEKPQEPVTNDEKSA